MRFPSAIRTSLVLVVAGAVSLVFALDVAAEHQPSSIGVQETTLTVSIPAIGADVAKLCLDVGDPPVPDVNDPDKPPPCTEDISVLKGSKLTLRVAAQRTSPPLLALGDPTEFCPDSAGVRLVHYEGSDAHTNANDGLNVTYTAEVSYEGGQPIEKLEVKDNPQVPATEGYERNAWLCLKSLPADPPVTTLNEAPPRSTRDTTARFRFSTEKTGSTFECRLNTPKFSACSSPVEYSGLKDANTFAVRAVDATKRRGPEVSHTWNVDSAAPTLPIDAGPASTGAPASGPVPLASRVRMPALAAAVTLRRQSLRRVLAQGLRFSVRCSVACRRAAELRSRSTGRLLGRVSAARAAGRRAMVLRLSKAGRAELARRRRQAVVLLVRVSDSAGSQRTISRAVTLRR